jgi:hypothetical protein
MGDIQNGIETLRRFVATRWWEIKTVVGRGRSVSASHSAESGTSFSGFSVWHRKLNTRQIDVIVGSGVMLRTYGSQDALARELGLFPESFAPTAWELAPWSFFADYFANIGDIIDGFSLVNGHLAWSYQTTRKVRRTSKIFTRTTNSNPYEVYSASVGNTVWEEKSIDRAILSSIVPPLDFKLPSFGSRTALNIAALAYQGNVPRPFY